MPRSARPHSLEPWSAPRGLIDTSVSPDLPIYVVVQHSPNPTPLDFHIHPELELGVVLAGEVERHLEGHVALAAPGSVWLCDAWELHAWRTAAPDTLQVVLHFDPLVIAGQALGPIKAQDLFAAYPAGRPQPRTPAERSAVIAIAEAIRDERLSRRPGWLSAVRLHLLRLLLALARNWDPGPAPRRRAGARRSSLRRIMPALTLAHENLSRRVPLREAAAACSMSRSQFCLVFRRTMGMSFAALCRRARLSAVAHNLLRTNAPVNRLAREAGFFDSSHLHRAFVAYYGCTPGQYRSRQRRARGSGRR